MEEKNVKEEIKKNISFLKNLKFPKRRWIILGLILLIVAFLLLDYLRFQINPNPVVGQVINTKNEPVEGAIITSGNYASESRADGLFRIKAKKSDTLSISAIGYETQTIKAEAQKATLTPLKPGNIRLVVVDPQNKEISDALVYRLDPNTSVPVDIKLSDNRGSVLFLNIPSGQAAFVILHPDYGVGWVETALDPGGYSRPVVRLQKVELEKKSAFRLINQAFAQGLSQPAPSPRLDLSQGKIVYEIKDVQKIGENSYEITDKSITVLTINDNSFDWKEYTQKIQILERERAALEQKGFDYDEAKNLQKFLGEQGLSNNLQAIRITPQWKDASNTYVEYGAKTLHYNPQTQKVDFESSIQPNEVYVSKTNVFRVEIKNPNPMDTMTVLQRRHYANRQIQLMNPNNYYATSLAEIPKAEEYVKNTGGIVIFDDPRRTVCCRGKEVDSRSAGDILSESGSNNTPPSPITIRDINNDKTSFTFNPVTFDFGPDLTAFQKIKKNNPRLEFTDKDGSKVSIIDVPPPHPDDAPTDFIAGGFFENSSEARDAFKTGSPKYQENWNNYLYMKANNSQISGGDRAAIDLYRDLRRNIGWDTGFRLNPASYNTEELSREIDSSTSDSEASPDELNQEGTEETTEPIPTEEPITQAPLPTSGQSSSSSCPPGAQYTCSR